jgi:hypothetical protein
MNSQVAAAPVAAPSVSFKTQIKESSRPELRGTLDAQVSPQGLVILQKGKPIAEFPVGSPIELVAPARVRVGQGSAAVTFVVQKMNGYPAPLASALTEFLSERRGPLQPAEFEFPKWLFGVALLPLALIAVGGLVGGLIGGAGAGLNLFLARRESWPVALRAIAMMGVALLTGGSYFVVAVGLSVWLHGGLEGGNSTGQAVAGPIPRYEPPPAVPTTEGTPPAASPLQQEFIESGIVRVPVAASEATCIANGPEYFSFSVGHADGAIRTFALPNAEGWNLVARIPGPVLRLQRLNGSYLIASTRDASYLVADSGSVHQLPWKWIGVLDARHVAAVEGENLVQRALAPPIPSPAGASGSESAPGPIPPEWIQPYGTAVDLPLPGPAANVTAIGTRVPSLGFVGGQIALNVSGEWIKERVADVPVTVVGSGGGTGLADGSVETGVVGPMSRRTCGSTPIRGLWLEQVWTIAINDAGEAWTFNRNAPDPPWQILTKEDLGPIRGLASNSGTIGVAGTKAIALYTSVELGARIRPPINP